VDPGAASYSILPVPEWVEIPGQWVEMILVLDFWGGPMRECSCCVATESPNRMPPSPVINLSDTSEADTSVIDTSEVEDDVKEYTGLHHGLLGPLFMHLESLCSPKTSIPWGNRQETVFTHEASPPDIIPCQAGSLCWGLFLAFFSTLLPGRPTNIHSASVCLLWC